MSTKKINTIFENFNTDSIKEFVNKYFLQIIYASIFILFIIFITIIASNKKTVKQTQLLTDYYQAINTLSNGNQNEAIETFRKIYYSKYSNNNLKTISGIRLAEILNIQNQKEESVKIYKEIYNMKNNDLFLKNLSGLAALNILINENDINKYKEIEDLLKVLDNQQNPIIQLVKEQEAMFELQRGNKEKGLDILNNILAQDIDQAFRNRVETIIGLYKNENI